MNELQLGNNKASWTFASGIAVVLLLAVVVLELVIPKPSLTAEHNKAIQKRDDLKHQVKMARARLEEKKDAVNKYSFKGTAEEVTPKILQVVNKVAADHKVAVKTFRPQKDTTSDGIVVLPYVLQIEGHYPDVLAFVKNADEPSTLFSVHLLQVAAADGETDNVNATIGIVAFALLPQETKPATTKPTQATNKQVVNKNG